MTISDPSTDFDPTAERPHIVDLPNRFYEDHIGRGLVGGIVLKELARTTRVKLSDVEVRELRSDAEFYVQMADDMDPGYRGLASSAAATLRRLEPIQLEPRKTRTAHITVGPNGTSGFREAAEMAAEMMQELRESRMACDSCDHGYAYPSGARIEGDSESGPVSCQLYICSTCGHRQMEL